MSVWLIFAGFVATFAIWPFILMVGRRHISPLFYATIAVQLILAGVIGSMVAITVGGVTVSIGNIAYAAVIMTTAAIFAATRQARIVRDAALLVLGVNTISLAVLWLTSQALAGPARSLTPGIPASAFGISIQALIVGTVLHIFGIVALAWIIEQARNATRSKALVASATLAGFIAVLSFDGVAFPLLATWWQPALAGVLASGWEGILAKVLLGVTFGVPLALFLAFFQHPVAVDEPELDLRQLLFVPRRRLLTRLSDAVEASSALAEQTAITLDRVTDGVIALDSAGRITLFNEPAVRLLGLASSPRIGQSFVDALHELGVGSQVVPLIDAAQQNTETTVVLEDRPAGRFLELRSFPGNGSVTILVRDITDERERQRQLEAAAQAEQQAADHLRQLDHLKNSFLTAVSHELRTPLTVVRGLAETIERGEHPDGLHLSDSDRQAVIAALVTNTERISTLLDDLLDLDRLLRGAAIITRERHDLAALIRQVTDDLQPGVPLVFELPDRLDADIDRIRIERIVLNLVANAVKYGEESPITVGLSTRGNNVRIEVRDHGPGIAQAQLTKVFEPFHRADVDHPRPGTGIGLTLVREFASLHGGDAWAVDTGGDGAHLVVEFPRFAGEDATSS